MSTYLAALWPALSSVNKKLTRAAILYPAMPFLGAEKQIGLERWLRGREQCQKLAAADAVIVSFGKSGRTWLRVLISRFYQLEYGLPEWLIGFDNFYYLNRAIPKIFFTHDNYVKDYSGNHDNKADYYDNKVVLLVRHPADVAVSQYHQWRYRMRDRKKTINAYPDDDVSIFDFVSSHPAGLEKTVDFMNCWASERDRLRDFMILRYEDLKADTAGRLDAVTRFIDKAGKPESIEGAVAYASFENMRKLETENKSWLTGGRMKAKDPSNPESFKTRRGKVGGFRDYFTEAEVEAILAYVDQHLDPVFGYGRQAAAAARGTAATSPVEHMAPPRPWQTAIDSPPWAGSYRTPAQGECE